MNAVAQVETVLGPGMNNMFINRHLSPNDLYRSFVMRGINHGLLRGDFAAPGTVSVITVYCIGRCIDVGVRQSMVEVATLTGLELCNGFPMDMYLNQAASRVQFSKAIGVILNAMYQGNAWSPINMVALSPEVIACAAQAPAGENAQGAAANETAQLYATIIAVVTAYRQNGAIDFISAYTIALHMSRHLIGNVIPPPAIIASQVAALMRRGSLTEAWATKYLDGVSQELNIQMLTPDQLIDVARKTWARISPTLTPATAETIIVNWNNLIPAHAIRMRTTITQASWAGLTTMTVIGRAMVLFASFPWPNITNAFRNEMGNFLAAVTAVGDNRYYGFGTNVEAVKSTLFKNLGYVAKELLVRGNNERSLSLYQYCVIVFKYKNYTVFII